MLFHPSSTVIKTESTPISVKERDLLKTLRETGRNGVIKLNVDGKELNVVLNDYQSDALKGEYPPCRLFGHQYDGRA